MAVCSYCGLEMRSADGCSDEAIVIGGRSYQPVRFGMEPGWRRVKGRCGDCNVVKGSVHHHGCDAERCPKCGHQSIGCDCLWAGEEHLAEDWVEEMEYRMQL